MKQLKTFLLFVLIIAQLLCAQENNDVIRITDQYFFHSYLYKIPTTNKYVLIDGTRHGREKVILDALKQRNIPADDVVFVFISHYHSDHTDGNFELQKTLKAPFACPFLECKYLTQNVPPPPPYSLYPWANILIKIITSIRKPSLVQYDAKVQLKGGEVLSNFGGLKVIHTPGHTNGSLSLVARNGDCFVGDVLFGSFVEENVANFHPLLIYEDFPKLYPSIKLLLNENCQTFYPDHGYKLDRKSVIKFLENNQKFLIEGK